MFEMSIHPVFFRGTRKIPPSQSPPDQISPNLTLTQILTLTQVGIHRGELTRGWGYPNTVLDCHAVEIAVIITDVINVKP